MKKKIKVVALLFCVVAIVGLMAGCQRQADKVSHNLSLEADSFNVARKLTVINTRAEDGNNAILFQMTGNFSIEKETDGDLAVIGENENGTYYKHFVYLSDNITYIVEDLGTTGVSKYKYAINFNPNMVIPVEITTVD